MLNFPKDETQELNIGGDLGCTSQFVSSDLFPWYLTPARTTTLNNIQQVHKYIITSTHTLYLTPAPTTTLNNTQQAHTLGT